MAINKSTEETKQTTEKKKKNQFSTELSCSTRGMYRKEGVERDRESLQRERGVLGSVCRWEMVRCEVRAVVKAIEIDYEKEKNLVLRKMY